MTVDVLVDVGPFQWTLARVECGKLRALRVVDLLDGIEDDVFLARVTAPAPELGGVFADLGRAAGVFVRLPRRLRRAPPAVGDTLLVQGVRDADRVKAGRASPTVRLEGGWLELRPGTLGGGVVEAVPLGAAPVLRAQARDLFGQRAIALKAGAALANEIELEAEAATLETLWDTIEARARSTVAPTALMTEEERLALALRSLAPGIDRLVTAPPDRLRVARLVAQARLAASVEGATDPEGEVGLDGGLAHAFQPFVPLDDGSALVIERTQALIAVDVDRRQARGMASAINQQSIDALADAVRVRELGGQIVVDFLEPEGEAGRKALEAALAQALAPVGAQIIAVLGSGLSVLERPQRRIALVDRVAPSRDAAEALLRDAVGYAQVVAAVATDVDGVLRQPQRSDAVERWLARTGTRLIWRCEPGLAFASYVVEDRTP